MIRNIIAGSHTALAVTLLLFAPINSFAQAPATSTTKDPMARHGMAGTMPHYGAYGAGAMDPSMRMGHMMGMDQMMGMGPMMGGGSMMMDMGPMMGGGSMMGALRSLDLTPEQRKQFRQLVREYRDQRTKIMDKLTDESEPLHDLWSKEKPDPKEISKVYERVFAVKRELIESAVTFRNRIAEQLTEPQRNKLKEIGPHWMMMN